MSTIRRALWAPLLILVVAACGSGEPSSQAAESEEASAEASAASSVESSAPAETTPAETTAAASIGPDTDLATLLPTTVAGQEWTVLSGEGEESTGALNGVAGGVAQALGVPAAELKWASAAAPNAGEPEGHVIWAVRFPGAEQADLVETVASGLGGVALMAGQIELTEETVAGRQVFVLPRGPEAVSTYYIYPVGEVLFVVLTPDEAEAEDAIGQLP